MGHEDRRMAVAQCSWSYGMSGGKYHSRLSNLLAQARSKTLMHRNGEIREQTPEIQSDRYECGDHFVYSKTVRRKKCSGQKLHPPMSPNDMSLVSTPRTAWFVNQLRAFTAFCLKQSTVRFREQIFFPHADLTTLYLAHVIIARQSGRYIHGARYTSAHACRALYTTLHVDRIFETWWIAHYSRTCFIIHWQAYYAMKTAHKHRNSWK